MHTEIPNTERTAIPWAWDNMPAPQARRSPLDQLVLLAYAELADRALWSGDGYSVTTPEEVAELLHLQDPSDVWIVSRFLANDGLLVDRTDGIYPGSPRRGFRIPEAAFGR